MSSPDSMDEMPESFTPGRRFRVGLQVLVSSLALLSIVVMVNYLALRHYWRWDLARENQFRLTPLSIKVLKSLTNNIQVVVFFDKDKTVFGSVRNLLQEYQYHYPRMTVEVVDYYRDAAGAQRVRTQFKLNSDKDQDMVIFESGGSVKKVYQRELADYDYSGIFQGRTNVARPQNFKGEQAFTSAVISVTEKQQSTAYFLQGHGEHDPSAEDELGYARFAQMLEEKNIRARPFRFGGTNSLPTDGLLVLGGPYFPMVSEELEQIDEFLNNGGRMLAFMNYQSAGRRTGLERIFAKWGVEVGNDRVSDPEHFYKQNDVFITQFTAHPTVRSLGKAGVYMILPRSVRRLALGGSSTDGLKVEEIAFTSSSGQVTEFRRPGEPAGPPEKKGQTPVIVAVEKGGVTGVKADRGSTRIVVAGDSVFATNQTLESLANREFVSDAVNWLLDRSLLVGEIGPRALHEYRLTLTGAQMNSLRWILLAGMPGAVMLIGLMVWARRSR